MDECRNVTLINMREEFLNFIMLLLKQVGMLKGILDNLVMDSCDSCPGMYDLVHWWVYLLMVTTMHLMVFAGISPLKWHIIYCNTSSIKHAMN